MNPPFHVFRYPRQIGWVSVRLGDNNWYKRTTVWGKRRGKKDKKWLLWKIITRQNVLNRNERKRTLEVFEFIKGKIWYCYWKVWISKPPEYVYVIIIYYILVSKLEKCGFVSVIFGHKNNHGVLRHRTYTGGE